MNPQFVTEQKMPFFRRANTLHKYIYLMFLTLLVVIILFYYLHSDLRSRADRFAPNWRQRVNLPESFDDDDSLSSLKRDLEELETKAGMKDLHSHTMNITQPVLQAGKWLRYEFQNYGVIRVTHQPTFDFSPKKLHELTAGSVCNAEEFYMAAITQLAATCTIKQRIGRKEDGGWDICMAEPFIPKSKSCISFSFGVGGIWEYDDEVATKLGCRNFVFDPSENNGSHTRSSGAQFFRIGVSDRKGFEGESNWQMQTLDAIVRELVGNESVIDLLKIDIEGKEWAVLRQAAETGILPRVKQLLIEFHTEEVDQKTSTVADYLHRVQVLQLLHEAGFRLWQTESNKFGAFFNDQCSFAHWPCCHNNYYINVKYLPEGQEKEAELMEALDQRKNRVQLPALTLPHVLKHSAESFYFSLMSANHAECNAWKRVGPQQDSGYNLCSARGYQLQPKCTVYSFGVADQFGFEDELASSYGCSVRMFDPSTQLGDHKRAVRERFYAIGLAGQDSVSSNGWTVRTFASLLKRFGDSESVIDVLKIDIESDEWASLEASVHDASLLKVKQLLLETHTRELRDERTQPADYIRFARIWLQLYRIGFRQWYSWQNPRTHFRGQTGQDRPCCHVHSLINIRFIPPVSVL